MNNRSGVSYGQGLGGPAQVAADMPPAALPDEFLTGFGVGRHGRGSVRGRGQDALLSRGVGCPQGLLGRCDVQVGQGCPLVGADGIVVDAMADQMVRGAVNGHGAEGRHRNPQREPGFRRRIIGKPVKEIGTNGDVICIGRTHGNP